MTSPARFLAAIAALGLAAPAAAQYQYPQQSYPYPQQTYPQQYPQQTYPYQGQQYGYGQQGYTGNPVTDIIDQLLGTRYNVTDRQAVRQCARAAMSQASAQYGGGYNRYGYNQQQYGGDRYRVTSITNVERRYNGLRVSGVLSAGGRYGGGYGGYGNQGYNGYAAGDLSFRCNVDYRGAVASVRVRPYDAYRRY